MARERSNRTVSLTVWLTPEEHEQLRRLADEAGMSMAVYVRLAIRHLPATLRAPKSEE